MLVSDIKRRSCCGPLAELGSTKISKSMLTHTKQAHVAELIDTDFDILLMPHSVRKPQQLLILKIDYSDDQRRQN